MLLYTLSPPPFHSSPNFYLLHPFLPTLYSHPPLPLTPPPPLSHSLPPSLSPLSPPTLSFPSSPPPVPPIGGAGAAGGYAGGGLSMEDEDDYYRPQKSSLRAAPTAKTYRLPHVSLAGGWMGWLCATVKTDC